MLQATSSCAKCGIPRTVAIKRITATTRDQRRIRNRLIKLRVSGLFPTVKDDADLRRSERRGNPRVRCLPAAK
jgi:hypothetical protein